jgi:hypothetical protein
VALAIDASTPAVAVNSDSAVAALTTASFTPPTVGHILVQWMGNTDPGVSYAVPTITDSAGIGNGWVNFGHATYNSSASGVNGMVSQWVSWFVLPPAMTITVTSPVASGARQAAMKAWVVTGSDTAGDSIQNAVGGYGKGDNNAAPASAFTQNIASQADYAMGFIATCDWDAGTAATAPAGYSSGGSGTIGVGISYSFIRKTTLDTLAGQDMPMTVTRTSTSNHLRWLYLELCPEAGRVESNAYSSGKNRKKHWGSRQARYIR